MDAGSTNWLGEFPSKLSYIVLVETGSCAFRMEMSFIHGTMVFLLFAAALDTERMVYHNETPLHTTMQDENRRVAQSPIHPFGRKCHFPRKNIFSVANGSCDRGGGMILMAVREMRKTAAGEKETRTTDHVKSVPLKNQFASTWKVRLLRVSLDLIG